LVGNLCKKTSCRCKFPYGGLSRDRTACTGKKQPYEVVHSVIKPISEDSSIDMKTNLLQEAIGEAIEFINGIEPKKWKTSKYDEKNKVESDGTFSQTFRCRFCEVADCNARFRVCGLVSDQSVEVKVTWWLASSAHSMHTSGFFFRLADMHNSNIIVYQWVKMAQTHATCYR